MSKVVVSAGSALSLLGDTTGPNGQIMTAAVRSGSFVGTAFGGGAYFEIVAKFDPATVQAIGAGAGWPSIWSLPVEKGLAPTGDQWAGQAVGYEHWNEVDFMEYIYTTSQVASYFATTHDFYGISPSFSQVSTSQNPAIAISALNSFHAYGALWTPATASSLGSMQYYLDRQPVGAPTTWSQFTTQTPPPASPWQYGVIDTQHLDIILGTGPGATLFVQSVNVWQPNSSSNLVH